MKKHLKHIILMVVLCATITSFHSTHCGSIKHTPSQGRTLKKTRQKFLCEDSGRTAVRKHKKATKQPNIKRIKRRKRRKRILCIAGATVLFGVVGLVAGLLIDKERQKRKKKRCNKCKGQIA